MSLLQIQEPIKNQSHSQSQLKYAIGIDLGTTHSLVAVDINGELNVLPDETGEVLLASVVQFQKNNQIEVGLKAKKNASSDPDNTLSSIKRLMGSDIRIPTQQGDTTPIVVSSFILKALMMRAQKALGKDNILGAVITVPAYFDEKQRQMTKEAAQLANIPVLRLLSEPTAAAVAYGLTALEGLYLVYDLGGGTFDISLLKCHQGVFQVLATGGDTFLGGDDMDQLLAQSKGITLEQARDLKIQLTGSQTAQTVEFNQLIAPLVKKTIDYCEQVLRDAKLTKSDCQEIILVGGATRVPLVQAEISAWFGKAPLQDLNVDRVVVMGAAKQAAQLARHSGDSKHLLLDVNPLSLGLEVMGGTVEKIIFRNAPIPAIVKQLFTTYQDNQTGLELHVVQGEQEPVEACRSLAKFSLKAIPPMRAGQAKIEVIFQMDADGLLQVSAKELSTGVEVVVNINTERSPFVKGGPERSEGGDLCQK